MYEDGATQASPPGLTGVVESTVLSHYHRVNRYAVITGLLCSQSKVESVTCVVLHNEKDSGGSCVRRKVVILQLILTSRNSFSQWSVLMYFSLQDAFCNYDSSALAMPLINK